ncbi:putative protein MLN51 plant [Helianthus annuus]|nr:putative protein MLN51 plant [Helianthus annuus]
MAEEDDYESDPEQTNLSLQMRRRTEASDDEEDDDADVSDARVRVRETVIDSRVSDYESDDQGAPAEYNDDDEEEEFELLEEEVEEDEVEGVIEGKSVGVERENDHVDQYDDNVNGGVGEQGEKKENEPFAVPTAGAFYMHDDRFRDRARGRHSLRFTC